MTTPADELRAAADRVQAWADGATNEQWRVEVLDVEDWGEEYHVVGFGNVGIIADTMDGGRTERHGNAAWIAGMGPHIAPSLAALLHEIREHATGPIGVPAAIEYRARVLAQLINQETT